MLDLAVIGAGPCGLAVGVAAKRAHLVCSLFDKGPVVSSLLRYPLYMTFFSTPEKLEIGVPFVTAGDKPTRREALAYYRRGGGCPDGVGPHELVLWGSEPDAAQLQRQLPPPPRAPAASGLH